MMFHGLPTRKVVIQFEASSIECPKLKDQIKVQKEKAKARQENSKKNLVIRGITFSNMVQNKTEKVQSY